VDWTEKDSATFRELADIAVPRRSEMLATLLAAMPFGADEAVRVIDLGSGEGRLSECVLELFRHATVTALDGSVLMREATKARTARFGDRISVKAFDLAALDWWDLMRGADVVVSSLCLHHLNDRKKQYLYKAAAERINGGGALIVADLLDPQPATSRHVAADTWDRAARTQAADVGAPALYDRFFETRWNHYRFPDDMDHPSPLLSQLVWLKHAGFPHADCIWLYAGHAVFGGFKESRIEPGPSFERALTIVESLRG
jgi:tRNA (cmo5U34)-methyltransferase